MLSKRITSDSDAPAVEPSVTRRLRSIHPGLKPVWKRYRLDYFTGNWLIAEQGEFSGRPVPWDFGGGRWVMCLENSQGFHLVFVVRDEDGRYMPLDHRVCDRLVLDAFMSARHKPDELAAIISDSGMVRTDSLRAKLTDLREQFTRANRRKFEEVLEGDNMTRGESPSRSARIFSYNGQPIRRTSRDDAIELTPEEKGYEVPDWKKEIHG